LGGTLSGTAYLNINGTVGATTPTTGVFTTIDASSTITPNQLAGIVGTNTNNDANAGSVGEYISSSVTGVTVATTATNVTSISVTAGDWDITIAVNSGGVPGTSTLFRLGLSTTSATFLTDYQEVCFVYQDTVQSVMSGCIPNMRKSIASTTTYYLVAQSYTTANNYVQGRISARRRR
jgi:hypothetical protein